MEKVLTWASQHVHFQPLYKPIHDAIPFSTVIKMQK
jgi:hypothetical protein